MGKVTTTEVEIETVVDGVELLIAFTRTTKSSPELYGADADGNRGMWITSIDSDEYTNVRVTFTNADPTIAIPIDVLRLPPSQKTAIEDAIQAWMDTHEPEAPEEPERDWDQDRDWERDDED